MVIDGVINGKGWTDNTWRTWPDWIQVTFPQAVTAGRALVWTNTIGDYEIRVQADDQWTKVAEGTRAQEQPITGTWDPREVTAVRVIAKSGSGDRTAVTEIEVYAK